MPAAKSRSEVAYNEFAKGTTVSTDASLKEMRDTVNRFGATSFAYAERNNHVAIVFDFAVEGVKRRVRYNLRLPDISEDRFRKMNRGAVGYQMRTEIQQREAWSKEVARLYRTLVWGIKLKLAFIQDGVRTFDEEFFSDIVLPNDRTVYEEARAQVMHSITAGEMAPILPGLPPAPDERERAYRRAIEGGS